MDSKRKALWQFVVITLAITWAFMGWIIWDGGIRSFPGMSSLFVLAAIMWIPGIVSLIVRLHHKLGSFDLGLEAGRRNYWILAFATPTILAFVSGIICHFLDIRLFGLPEAASLHARISMIPLLAGIGIIGALGEELGWRGFSE